MASAGKVVTWSFIGSGLIVGASTLSEGRLPEPYIVLGGGGLFIIMGALSDVQPDIAKAMALLVFVGILLAHSDGLFAAIDNGLRNVGRKQVRVRRGGKSSGRSPGGLPGPGSPDDPRINPRKKGKRR